MNCLLCGINKANATGSHLVPAWMLEPVVGARDFEKSVSIDLQEIETDEFYGRNRLDNPSTEISQNPQVYNYIFCQACEDWLGALESEVAPFLKTKIYEERFSSQFSNRTLTNGSILKICKQYPAVLLDLFFYSVIWRTSLKHRLESGASQFHVQIDESMRLFMSGSLWKSIKELKRLSIQLPYYYTLVTSLDIEDCSANSVNIDPEFDNPTTFFLGKFLALVHCGDKIPVTGNGLRLQSEIMDGALANHNFAKETTIVFLSQPAWFATSQYWANKSAEKWCRNAIEAIAVRKGISRATAHQLLKEQISHIISGQVIRHTDAMILAFKQIMAS